MARNLTLSLRGRCRQRRHCANAQSHNAAHSRLYNLGAELLDIIYQNLSLETSIAMSLTCARFYHSTTFASVRPDPKSPGETHFKALCMLEYDGDIKGYCCRGCLSKHSTVSFSCEELKKGAAERYCLRTKLCLRVGDGKEFSFADMQRILGASKEKKIPTVRLRDRLAKSCRRPTITIEETIFIFPWFRPIFEWEFVTFCCKLNLPLCPHMRTGDLKVFQLYPPYRISSYAKPLSCDYCKTKVIFAKGHSAADGAWAVFKTRRSIGRLVSPLEPTWLAQTFASKAPGYDDFYKAHRGWLLAYWGRQPARPAPYTRPLEKFDYPDPDTERAFTLPTLPKTLSSQLATLRIRVRSLATLHSPEKLYKSFQLPRGGAGGS